MRDGSLRKGLESLLMTALLGWFCIFIFEPAMIVDP